MPPENQIRAKKVLIILLAVLLAAWVIVSWVTTRLAPIKPNPATWHTVPYREGTTSVFVTPVEALIMHASPIGLPLSILLVYLITSLRKTRKRS